MLYTLQVRKIALRYHRQSRGTSRSVQHFTLPTISPPATLQGCFVAGRDQLYPILLQRRWRASRRCLLPVPAAAAAAGRERIRRAEVAPARHTAGRHCQAAYSTSAVSVQEKIGAKESSLFT
jgi:hypothetical protein